MWTATKDFSGEACDAVKAAPGAAWSATKNAPRKARGAFQACFHPPLPDPPDEIRVVAATAGAGRDGLDPPGAAAGAAGAPVTSGTAKAVARTLRSASRRP